MIFQFSLWDSKIIILCWRSILGFSFNSLCEIHIFVEDVVDTLIRLTFNSLCEIPRRIVKADVMGLLRTFNSLCEIRTHRGEHHRRWKSRLSILFVRFWFSWVGVSLEGFIRMTFNSLCEILLRRRGRDRLHTWAYFQFSLWDSRGQKWLILLLFIAIIFQFSLWDSR